MALVARYPFAQAPGMGLNAYFAYTVVLGQKIPWETALGAVFVSGALLVARIRRRSSRWARSWRRRCSSRCSVSSSRPRSWCAGCPARIVYGIVTLTLLGIVTHAPLYPGPHGALVPFGGFAG